MEDSTISSGAGLSIEQSVRVFKVFEILRGGDKAAVSEAIKETSDGKLALEGTTILHLAVQVADSSVVEQVLSQSGAGRVDVNDQDRDGNTPLHLAATLGRANLVRLLLAKEGIDSSVPNYQGRLALDLVLTIQ